MSNATLEEHPIRYSLETMLLPGKFAHEISKKDPEFKNLPPILKKFYIGMYTLPALAADAAVIFGAYKGIGCLLK
jgi:hypothetical protein